MNYCMEWKHIVGAYDASCAYKKKPHKVSQIYWTDNGSMVPW